MLTILHTKEEKAIRYCPTFPESTLSTKNKIAKEAPKAAELEIPNVKGEAKGFLIRLCETTPETESTAPVSTEAKILGSRIRVITLFTVLFSSVQKSLILFKLISKAPMNIAI